VPCRRSASVPRRRPRLPCQAMAEGGPSGLSSLICHPILDQREAQRPRRG
jgi:hypothetical protein